MPGPAGERASFICRGESARFTGLLRQAGRSRVNAADPKPHGATAETRRKRRAYDRLRRARAVNGPEIVQGVARYNLNRLRVAAAGRTAPLCSRHTPCAVRRAEYGTPDGTWSAPATFHAVSAGGPR